MTKGKHALQQPRLAEADYSPAPEAPPEVGFRPAGSKVLVMRDGVPDVIGSIVVPEVAKEEARSFWATVVAVGPGRRLDGGGRRPMPVKRGDRVLLNRYGGPRVVMAGREMLVVDDTDVKAIGES